MKTLVGIWLDRRKAILVTLDRATMSFETDAVKVVHIASDVEPRVRLSGGSRTGKTPWGPQQIAVDSKSEDRRNHQLKLYFRRILDAVKSGNRIFIMGPGETKLQLVKELRKSAQLSKKIAAVETCDKMTDRQVAARIREFFEKD